MSQYFLEICHGLFLPQPVSVSVLNLCSWYSVVNPFRSTDEVYCVEALALLVRRPVYGVFEKVGKGKKCSTSSQY
jgi:hypothetical protein